MSVRVRYGDDVRLPRLPVAPLATIVDRVVTGRKPTIGKVAACAEAGCTDRQLRAWIAGEYQTVSYDVADRVLIALGLNWFDVWDEADYPEVHERLAA